MGKRVKIVLDMQAYFEERITFFGRKVNKVPCIIGANWGKINFLGIFGVETDWIIGQKSQNSARYRGAFHPLFIEKDPNFSDSNFTFKVINDPLPPSLPPAMTLSLPPSRSPSFSPFQDVKLSGYNVKWYLKQIMFFSKNISGKK